MKTVLLIAILTLAGCSSAPMTVGDCLGRYDDCLREIEPGAEADGWGLFPENRPQVQRSEAVAQAMVEACRVKRDRCLAELP